MVVWRNTLDTVGTTPTVPTPKDSVMIAFLYIFLANVALVKSPRKGLTVAQNAQRNRLLGMRRNTAKNYWQESRKWEALLQQDQGRSDYVIIAQLENAKIAAAKMSGVAALVGAKAVAELEAELEAYAPPVPVAPSTMPTYWAEYTDYSHLDLQGLQAEYAKQMKRLQAGSLLAAKVSRDYKTRGELIEASLWGRYVGGKQVKFQCAPKGTLKRYYAAIRQIRKDCRTLEFEIARAERAEGSEVADSVTMWNTSGLCGPAGGEDNRRFPTLKPAITRQDTWEMKHPAPPTRKREDVDAYMAWRARVDGEDFTQHHLPESF